MSVLQRATESSTLVGHPRELGLNKDWTSTGMKSQFSLRQFEPSDGQACLALFQDTIERVNFRDYTAEQRAAWAAAEGTPYEIDRGPWLRRFTENFSVVAEQNGQVIGFADLTIDGYLDRLFVSADHQRLGVASGLVETLVDQAIEWKLPEISTEASITARPFFERQGFVVAEEQLVSCRGVMLKNFRMIKAL